MELKELEGSKLRWLPAQKTGFILTIVPVILALPAFLYLDIACDSFISFVFTILFLILLMILLLVGVVMSLFALRINREWLCRKFACNKCDSCSHAPTMYKNVKIEPLDDPWVLNAIIGLINLMPDNGDHIYNTYKEVEVAYVLRCSICGQLSQHNYRYLRGSTVFDGWADNDDAKVTRKGHYYG